MQEQIRSSAAHFAALASPYSLSEAARAMRERIANSSLATPEPQPTRPLFQLNRRRGDAKNDERVEQRARRIATTMNRRNILFGDPEYGTVVRIVETVDKPCPVVSYEHLRELVLQHTGEEIDVATARHIEAMLLSRHRL